MKKWTIFKDQETDETKGHHFFVEDDLRSLGKYKLDASGKAALTVLRHLGRLREVRGDGLIRYIPAY